MSLWTSSAAQTCRRHALGTSLARALATAAASDASASAAPPSAPPRTSKSDPSLRPPAPKPQLHVATVVNRAPLLTRTPTPLERTYHAYQQRLQRALHNPFPGDFYFKQGAPLEAKFNTEERAREQRAFGKGFSADAAKADDADAEAVEVARQFEEMDVQEAPRRHPADVKGDTRSLDRQGERNLYLLLLKKDTDDQFRWILPEGSLQKGELLHEAAERDLFYQCGSDMDSWIVSRNPIGVFETPSQPSRTALKAYTFLYKAHILAGQVVIDGENIQDFAWLTKEEIKNRISPTYWQGVKDVLSDF